jgi:hypothetical protein
MSCFQIKSPVLFSLPFLIFLSGCDAKPECDSIETRSAVLNIVSDDHRNPLAAYAARNSTSNDITSEANRSVTSENTRPLYLLGRQMVTGSTSEDKRTL